MPIEEMVMTDYSIEKIENGIATVRYADDTWAELVLSSDMTEAQLDDLAHQFAPKQGVAPSFAKVGFKSTASALPIEEDETPENPAWLQARMDAYGHVTSQLEYITENGLDKWQEHVAKIKADNPKTE
tara:strand:- start:192 stop:575 length:384 start_codon:yes stop_codon:yes gene_type:complete